MTNFELFQTVLSVSALTALTAGLLILRHKLYHYGK